MIHRTRLNKTPHQFRFRCCKLIVVMTGFVNEIQEWVSAAASMESGSCIVAEIS
jgi:hypothetical protein